VSQGNGNASEGRKPKTIQELGEKAENYVEAHATDVVFGIDSKPSNIRSLRSELRQCRVCHGIGHFQHQCPNSLSPRGIRRNANASTTPQSQQKPSGLMVHINRGNPDILNNLEQVYGVTHVAKSDTSHGIASRSLSLLRL